MRNTTFDLNNTLIDLSPLRDHIYGGDILEELKMKFNSRAGRVSYEKLMGIFSEGDEVNVFLGLDFDNHYVFIYFPNMKVVSIEDVLGEGALNKPNHRTNNQHWDGVSVLEEGMIVGHHLSPDDSVCIVKAFNEETVCISYGDNEIDLVDIDQIYSLKLRSRVKNLVSE